MSGHIAKKREQLSAGRKRIAGYVRVSTEMQAERGESMAVQEERLHTEADRSGFELVLCREPGGADRGEDRWRFGSATNWQVFVLFHGQTRAPSRNPYAETGILDKVRHSPLWSIS